MKWTILLPPDLVERTRNAVYALSGPPHRLTIAGVAEEAIRATLLRLEAEHNRGDPFPQRDDDEHRRGGRPVGG